MQIHDLITHSLNWYWLGIFGIDDLIIAVALIVVSEVITVLTTPKPANNDAKPNLLSDFDFAQSDEGTPQIIVFGDAWLPDWEVLWYGNLRNQAIHAQGSGGKK